MPVPEIDLNLLDPAFTADPYQVYARLRSETPVFYHPRLDLIFFTRYADVAALLKDRRLGRDYAGADRSGQTGPFARMHDHSLMEMEPPDHTRLRGLINKVFTPARAEALRGRVEEIAQDLLDAAAVRGQMDLLADFAEPLPVAVIAELLGVPAEARDRLRPWSRDIVQMYELSPNAEDARRADQAVAEFSDFVGDLAERRRSEPADDLISSLVQVREAGDRLITAELVATTILLLNAGHEATVNAIANGMLALFRQPEALDGVRRADPIRLRSAVEELLRFDTPLQLFKRWVREDLVIEGVALRAGQRVALLYGSANRDLQRFSDPDRLVLDRTDNAHLTFGAGIHYCLGAPLARVEIQVAVSALLRRFGGLRLAGGELEYRPTYVIRGLRALPVLLS